MKIIVTGALGNISLPLTKNLVANGHDVIVVSRTPERKSEIENLGAKAAIGELDNADFLTETFSGADSVYLMIPPDYRAADMTAYISEAGKIYAEAVKKSGVKNLVVLSSMGAHLPLGNGPLSALTLVEKTYNDLQNVNITYLRPGGFYVNYLPSIGLIKAAGIIGDNTSPESRMLLTHPADIADVAADALQNPVAGTTYRFIISQETTNNEIASTIGNAIGKPELPWVQFPAADYKGALIQHGFSESAAQSFVEMGDAFREGRSWEEVDARPQEIVRGKRSFADFVKEVFVPAYNA
ncbi:NAD(P)H-binding protein [Flavobacterium silvaticum]|uniref:NAD(P)H-binding protein n=1 Tax=Flavobacterium silvaticum TaxID=1852020 RepID=A0A972FLR7_9FLAO|nr:NAD(P)H-binding protein [Flavobacterium silvaticum]NMH28336.1 NAD(P)H-binding protein [Flavobacterium silvaticum]